MKMTIPSDQLRFDFNGKTFDKNNDFDKKTIAWVLNQILYGEITGIQCGYWLYNAPTINAATFLAKQSREELSHVRKILRILSIIGEKPADVNRVIKFLTSGMMGNTWGEHVAIEMALGEGLVLPIFYFLQDTITIPEVQKILATSIIEEESHVSFGEQETIKWLSEHPKDKKRLLTIALIQFYALKLLKFFVSKRIATIKEKHSVLSQFNLFFDHVINSFEKRIQLLGLSSEPITSISMVGKIRLILLLPIRGLFAKNKYKLRKLTETYLTDSVINAEFSSSED
jgi:1,2-phenylacetyl-CoA epoxidase catalytic subunit